MHYELQFHETQLSQERKYYYIYLAHENIFVTFGQKRIYSQELNR